MGPFIFFEIIILILFSVFLFTVGIILRRNKSLLKYLRIDVKYKKKDSDSIKDIDGLISFCGKVLQWISVIIIIAQFSKISLLM